MSWEAISSKRLDKLRELLSELSEEWQQVALRSTHAHTKKYYLYFSQELSKELKRFEEILYKIEWPKDLTDKLKKYEK